MIEMPEEQLCRLLDEIEEQNKCKKKENKCEKQRKREKHKRGKNVPVHCNQCRRYIGNKISGFPGSYGLARK